MVIGSGYRFQFSGFPVTVGAVSNRTIGVNLVVFRVRETLFSPVGTICL